MKNIFLISFILFSLTTYSQEIKISIYDDAIEFIKKSEELKEYSIKTKSKNNKLKVSTEIFSICELYGFFEDKMNPKIKNYCETHDWNLEKVTTVCELKNRSDKGKRAHYLSFTCTMENYFIAEVKAIDNTTKSLRYLFEIKDGKTVLIDVDTIYHD